MRSILTSLMIHLIAFNFGQAGIWSQQLTLAAHHPTVEVEKNTFTYWSDSVYQLELDLFLPKGITDQRLPVVLFMHGGGFYTGSRTEPNIEHFCDSLAHAGFAVANISYRLTLANDPLKFSCKQALAKKIAAIDAAATDLNRAAAWLLSRAEEFNLDSARFTASGSSAGAEAVLHAAYVQTPTEATTILPKAFAYRALMAFSGAVLDTTFVRQRAIPTLLYHGTCDALVPYGSALHHYCDPSTPGAMHLHGSYTLYELLRAANQTVRLVTRCRGQHGSAVIPIEQDLSALVEFLDRVNRADHFIEHEIIETAGKPCQLGEWCHCKD